MEQRTRVRIALILTGLGMVFLAFGTRADAAPRPPQAPQATCVHAMSAAPAAPATDEVVDALTWMAHRWVDQQRP